MKLRAALAISALTLFSQTQAQAAARCRGETGPGNSLIVTIDLSQEPRRDGLLDVPHAQVVNFKGKDEHFYKFSGSPINSGRPADIGGASYQQFNIPMGKVLGNQVLSLPVGKDGDFTAYLGSGSELTKVTLTCEKRVVAPAKPQATHNHGAHNHGTTSAPK